VLSQMYLGSAEILTKRETLKKKKEKKRPKRTKTDQKQNHLSLSERQVTLSVLETLLLK